MGAGDNEALEAAREYVMGYRFGLREMRDFALEDSGYLRIVAWYGVADDDAIDVAGNPLWVKAHSNPNAEFFKECAHRWVEMRVNALDMMACLGEHSCQRSHRRAPDWQEIETFGPEV
jgi:hypothetical protein